MGHGQFTVYTATMAAAGTTAVFDCGRSFRRVYLQVPTMTSVANLDIYAANVTGGSYYQVGKDVPNTTTIQSWSFTVAASAAANGRMVPIPDGLQVYKVVADSAPAGAQAFKLLCAD
jgi:hypothetical protein